MFLPAAIVVFVAIMSLVETLASQKYMLVASYLVEMCFGSRLEKLIQKWTCYLDQTSEDKIVEQELRSQLTHLAKVVKTEDEERRLAHEEHSTEDQETERILRGLAGKTVFEPLSGELDLEEVEDFEVVADDLDEFVSL